MSQVKILIVEDEGIVAKDLESMVKKMGFHVAASFPSGEEALAYLKTKKVHLILMDVMLKGKLNGIATAKTVNHEYGIPVVYLTAYGDEQTVQKAKHTEPFGYLVKPIDETNLRTTIEIALYKNELNQKLKKAHDELEVRVKERTEDLVKTNEALLKEIEERKRMEKEKEHVLNDLNAKIKELTSVSYSAHIFRSEMLRSHMEREHLQEAKEKAFNALRVRVKELTVLKQIAFILQNESIPDEQLLKDVVSLMLNGFDVPEQFSVKILLKKLEIASENFNITPFLFKQKFVLRNGEKLTWEVYKDLPAPPSDDTLPFAQEEMNFIFAVMEMLKTYFDKKTVADLFHQQLNIFHQLINSIPNPIFYKDKNGTFQGCNQSFESYVGVTKEKIIGKKTLDLVMPESGELHQKWEKELFEKQENVVYPGKVKLADGKTREVIFNKSLYYNQDGSHGGLICIMFDLEEQKNLEKKLLKKNQGDKG